MLARNGGSLFVRSKDTAPCALYCPTPRGTPEEVPTINTGVEEVAWCLRWIAQAYGGGVLSTVPAIGRWPIAEPFGDGGHCLLS